MESIQWGLAVACVLVVALNKVVLCIECVQCESFEDPECTGALIPPTLCPPYAIGCLTYLGAMPIPGEQFVIRDCAYNKMKPFCKTLGMRGNNPFMHSICLFTCFTDGCNDKQM